jgi:hypothetical protein
VCFPQHFFFFFFFFFFFLNEKKMTKRNLKNYGTRRSSASALSVHGDKSRHKKRGWRWRGGGG